MSARVPVTVVTGFLGAGKTTLIRKLIGEAGGARIGLIINEFGDMGFDAGLVSECLEPDCTDEVVELTNGCLCCTVADDFVPALEKILARGPERIIIETSGLALPQPLIAAFGWPTVKTRVTIDAVVTVVDAPAVLSGQFADDPAAVADQRAQDEALDHHSPLEELFDDQLKAADLVVLSKTDQLSSGELDAVKQRVSEDIRPGVATLTGSASPTVFGIEAAAEENPAARDGHHTHDDDHEHDDFASVVVPVAFPERTGAEAAVRELTSDNSVLRVKGSVGIEGKTAPLLVQAVGPRCETWYGQPGHKPSGLVVIGLSPMSLPEVSRKLRASESA